MAIQIDPWEFLVEQIYDNRQFCVYGHYCDEQLFYIGCGAIDRAFQFGPGCRNEAWHQFRANRPVTVRIFLRMNTKAEARKHEMRMIREYGPIANEPRGAKIKPQPALAVGMREVITCYPSGQEFGSIKEATQATGISQGAISNSISGRYPIVRGLRFAREPRSAFEPLMRLPDALS